jgi:hypothetical protein
MFCKFIPDTHRKWLTLMAGLMIFFANGAFYSMGNLTPYMISYLRVASNSTVRYSDAKWFTLALTLSGTFTTLLIGLMAYNLKKIPLTVYIFIGSIFYW